MKPLPIDTLRIEALELVQANIYAHQRQLRQAVNSLDQISDDLVLDDFESASVKLRETLRSLTALSKEAVPALRFIDALFLTKLDEPTRTEKDA